MTEDSDSWRTWAKSRACTLWREALEDPRGYGGTKKGRGRSKSPAATATWEPKGSISPAPNAARSNGDGLVDRVKAEKANRERKASRGAEKRASSTRQKKDKAASSNRDVKMKDDDQDEFVDDMSFVEDLSLDDGYDLSDIVNWDVPELEKIAYVFLHRLFAVFRPTETSAVDGIMKKYSDELIALMGCVAKKYVDGTQAANMLKAVLNLKTVDPESFGKEYLEQSLRAADALMEEDTADPELPKFGQPKIGAKTGDGPRRGRKADREQPDEPQRLRSGRQQRSVRPLEGRRGARLPPDPPGRKEERRTTTGESTSVGKEKLPKSESQDSAEKGRTPDAKCRQDLLDLGIDPNLPSEINSQYLDLIFDGDARTSKKQVHVWLQCPTGKNGSVRCTVWHHADYVAPTVPNEMKAWYQNVFIRRSESTAWEWHSRWLWPGTRVDFGDTVYRVATFMVPHRMNQS